MFCTWRFSSFFAPISAIGFRKVSGFHCMSSSFLLMISTLSWRPNSQVVSLSCSQPLSQVHAVIIGHHALSVFSCSFHPHKPLSLQVAVDFKAMVARVGHDHVSVWGQSQALRSVQRVSRRVDVRQKRPAAVKDLKIFNENICCYDTFCWPQSQQASVCTCIRLLPQSATMMFPLVSTATPVGALNWPFPSPFEPNFNTSSPSGVNTWPKKNSIVWSYRSNCPLMVVMM